MPPDAKRKPLHLMIAMQADKLRKGDKGGAEEPDGDEAPGYEPPADELTACEDVMDAVSKGDAKELSRALHNWMELAGYSKSSTEG